MPPIRQRPLARYFTNIFLTPPIYDVILSCFSYPEIIRISRTCRTARHAVTHFSLRAYNINRHLSQFFNDPIAFRNLQARTASLISGSNVIQFLDRVTYPNSDLDVFVPGIHVKEVGEWILREGYAFVPTERQCSLTKSSRPTFEKARSVHKSLPDEAVPEESIGADPRYPIPSLTDVFTFEKDGKKVQLIKARHGPLHCVIHFHSTCVMNFITYEGVYSLYPKATFVTRASLIVKDVTVRDAIALDKYVSRGWKIILSKGDISAEAFQNLFSPVVPRHPRDEFCWRFPLGTEDIKGIPSHGDPALYNSWSLSLVPDFHMSTHVLESEALTYHYSFASWQLKHDINAVLASYLRFYKLHPVKFDAQLYEICNSYFENLKQKIDISLDIPIPGTEGPILDAEALQDRFTGTFITDDNGVVPF